MPLSEGPSVPSEYPSEASSQQCTPPDTPKGDPEELHTLQYCYGVAQPLTECRGAPLAIVLLQQSHYASASA